MKERITETQVTFALRQAASGTSVSEITRMLEIADVTFYRKCFGLCSAHISSFISASNHLDERPEETIALHLNHRFRSF